MCVVVSLTAFGVGTAAAGTEAVLARDGVSGSTLIDKSPRTLVVWATWFYNRSTSALRVTSMRALRRRGVATRGVRMRVGGQAFGMGRQRHIDRTEPAWRWTRLHRLPTRVPPKTTVTFVMRLTLRRGATRGYIAGVAINLRDQSGDRLRVLVPEFGAICFRRQCPDDFVQRLFAATRAETGQ
jgi:hypothetical protein